MTSNEVEDTDHGYEDAVEAIQKMAGDPSVTVGVHGKDSEPYSRGQGSPITTVQLAAIHEFGTLDRYEDKSKANPDDGKRGVPQRSFLRSNFDDNLSEYEKLIKRGAGKVIDGDLDPEQLFGLIGAKVTGDTQDKISSNIPPPLTDAAIESKVKESTTALIDTGQLRQAISWETDV